VKSSKKADNLWFRLYYFAASFVTWIALRFNWTPNQITITGALLNFAGFAYFMLSPVNTRTIVVTYIILNFAHVLDCADGQLAFVANMRSELGYWLDSSLDVFKCAYLCLILTRTIYLHAVPNPIADVFRSAAVFATIGNLVNYAVSIHALRFREGHDGYAQKSFTKPTGTMAFRNYIMHSMVSHLREYGNFLLSFLAFAADQRFGLCLVIVLGMSHWFFAARRVEVISQRLRLTIHP
jgi:phosphatidylglycerophosphate synthase